MFSNKSHIVHVFKHYLRLFNSKMDTKTFICNFKVLILIFFPLVIYTQEPCPKYPCAPGRRCGLVRHGSGPLVKDCINLGESMLLERALRTGISGPGTGISRSRSRHYPVYTPRRWRQPRIFHHPGQGVLRVAGANHGVPGVIPLLGGGHIHVPVAQSVRDQSERININLTVENDNINTHDQSGSGNSRISQVAGPNCPSPCGPIGECPELQYCMFDGACESRLSCQTLP